MAAWEICLQDSGVSEGFTHKMAACGFCANDSGVSEGFTHKMAAWKICLQDGDNATFLRVLPTRWRQQTKRKQKQRRIYITFS